LRISFTTCSRNKVRPIDIPIHRLFVEHRDAKKNQKFRQFELFFRRLPSLLLGMQRTCPPS
jgi:hypothetical protein